MKTLKNIFLLASLATTPAMASTQFDYDQTTVDFVEALSHCSVELGNLRDMSDFLGEASFAAPRPADQEYYKHYYTIAGFTGGFWFIEAKKVAILSITKTVDARDLPTDRPARMTYECNASLVAHDE